MNKPLFSHGNAHRDGASFGHWFVGDLASWAAQKGVAPPDAALRQTEQLEIKWGFHPAGEQRADWASGSEKRTLSVLVRGRFLLRFRNPTHRSTVTELRLVGEGDYAIWQGDVEHTWIVEEDAVILTVRWRD